jgi:hypothetical protein
MPRRGTLLVLFVLLVGVAGVPVAGLAHTGSSVGLAPVSTPEPLPADPRAELRWSADGTLTIPAALAGAGVALGLTLIILGHRGRRLGVLALVLVLTLIAFEGAVHSVHHVGDPVGADHCRAAAVAERLSAVGAEQPVSAVPAPPPLGSAPVEPPCLADRASFAAAAGRSPPA